MFAYSFLIPLAALVSSTHGLAFNGPKPTHEASPREGDLLNPPEPTKAPYLSPELLKRQNVQVDLVAPDNTCGYISGLAGAAYNCFDPSAKCAFFPSTSGTYGFIGCCNTLNCGARLTCVDSSQFYSSTFCDNGCVKDTFTLKCTASTAPYCNGIRFPNEGVQDFFCDAISVSTWQTASTTYSLEKGRTFSHLTVTLSTADGGSAVASGSSISSPSPISNPESTPVPTIPGGVSTTTSPVVPTTSEPTKKSTPVGAIAGGTVGGVAVLAAAALGIFFFLRRKNKKPADANNGVQPPAYAQGPGESAYAATAAKPPGAQDPQYGAYGPQGYAPVPQQQYQQQPYGQQYQAPQMAEAPGNSNYLPAAAAATGAAYDPHHSSISQGPATPYSQNSQPLSPNSATHLTGGYPDRGETTSPMSQTRMSVGGEGHSPMGASAGGSPPQQYQAYTPYVPPTATGGHAPAEMSANMAGPWPTNLHEGTYEAPGSEIPRPQHQ